MLHKLTTLRTNQRRLGFLPGACWSVLNAANRHGLVRRYAIRIHPSCLLHPVKVRMGASSDPEVFRQLFIENELEFIDRLGGTPKVVVDLGANVGYASALFLSRWPSAFVLAVEPDPANALLCAENLLPYGGRARVVTGAVWHTAGGLVLSRGTFGDGREWATEVREARDAEVADVQAWDLPGLIAMCPRRTVDLLKIDIEGSERALFSANLGWIDSVRNLCVELHGPACEQVFNLAMAEYDHVRSVSGEYIVCSNLSARARHESRSAEPHL